MTANAGTNLNTSLLALESGGNLAALVNGINVAKFGAASFSLGQQLAAASLPIVLTAAQITTLTPPAAITNYALETGGNLATLVSGINRGRIGMAPRLVRWPTTEPRQVP